MNQADELQRQVTPLAERIRTLRAVLPEGRERGGEGLAAMEARLAKLWIEIRTARAATDVPPAASTRGKWH